MRDLSPVRDALTQHLVMNSILSDRFFVVQVIPYMSLCCGSVPVASDLTLLPAISITPVASHVKLVREFGTNSACIRESVMKVSSLTLTCR